MLDDHVPIEQGVTPPGKPGRGLRFVKDDGNASLWRVVAKPLPLITLGPGFDPLEGPTGAQSQWLAANNGDIELLAPCSSCSGSLVVNTWSLARPFSVPSAALAPWR